MGKLSNIPDIHAGERHIPRGKVLISDRPPESDPRRQRITLDERIAWGRTRVRLFAQTPGWAIAGSTMRWDNGCYGFDYEAGGAVHSRAFKTFDEARQAFAALRA